MRFLVLRSFIKRGGGRVEAGSTIDLDGYEAERRQRHGNVAPVAPPAPPPPAPREEPPALAPTLPAPPEPAADEPPQEPPTRRRRGH